MFAKREINRVIVSLSLNYAVAFQYIIGVNDMFNGCKAFQQKKKRHEMLKESE